MMAVWSEVLFSDLYNTLRLDAQFYKPEYLESETRIERHPAPSLAELTSKIDVGHVGSMVSHYAPDGVPLLQTRNVREFFLDMDGCVRVEEQFHRALRKSQVHTGDILIARSGSFGCAAMYFAEQIVNSADIIIIRPIAAEVHPLYLLAFINSCYGQFQIIRFASGGVQGHVNLTILEDLRVPLPPRDVQNSITDSVAKAHKRAEEAKSLYACAEGLLLSELGLADLDLSPTLFYERRYSQVRQAARFDAEYYQPKYYRLLKTMEKTKRAVPLGSILRHCERGLQPEYDEEGEVVVVNTKHMGAQFLSDEFERCSEDAWEHQKRAQLQQYDVLFYSTGAYIGRTNCWFNDCKAIGSNHVTIIRPSQRCNPIYLSLFMNSQAGLMQADRHAHGSAQREVYPADIRAYTVWLPTMRKQEKFAQMLLDSKAARDESRRLLEEAKRMVEEAVLAGRLKS